MKRFLLAIAILSIVAPTSAVAHDHRPPRATLRINGDVQNGWRYHADGWSRSTNEPGICSATFETGFPKFRKPLKHQVGDEITVRLYKAAVPMEVNVYRWLAVSKDGSPAGEPTPLPFLLRPQVVNDAIEAWEVVVALPAFDGHLYLGLDAYWADEDGCMPPPDLGSQSASWTFHAVSV